MTAIHTLTTALRHTFGSRAAGPGDPENDIRRIVRRRFPDATRIRFYAEAHDDGYRHSGHWYMVSGPGWTATNVDWRPSDQRKLRDALTRLSDRDTASDQDAELVIYLGRS